MKSIFKHYKDKRELKQFRNNLEQYDLVKVTMNNGDKKAGTFHNMVDNNHAWVYVGGYGFLSVHINQITKP